MRRPIAISLSPNTQKDDVVQALKLLFSPINWFNLSYTRKLEKEFADYFGKEYKAISVNSGRSALYLILRSIGVEGAEVVLQALTCIAVPNSIRWAGARPLFVDIDRNYNIDPGDLKKKINKRTKAVIVQNTFGCPANYDEIKKIANNNKVKIIEDCAISLGASYKGKKVGTIGDVAFFSFGRDKIISSVFGGMILCRDKNTYESIKSVRDSLEYPNVFWVIQQLLHPILFVPILKTYFMGYGKFSIGKMLLFVLQKIKVLSRAVYKEEKRGIQPKYFPKKMPGALALLATKQFNKLNNYNVHRTEVATIYFNGLKSMKNKLPVNIKGSVWLRFPVLVENKNRVLKYFKSRNMLLGDWYNDVVTPKGSKKYVGYIKGSCPKAEKISDQIVNLPTYPTLTFDQAKLVIEYFNKCKISQ